MKIKKIKKISNIIYLLTLILILIIKYFLASFYILLKNSLISTPVSKTITLIYKEYFINSRNKVFIILNNKILIIRIIKVVTSIHVTSSDYGPSVRG